jgi:hypothetical protein
MGECGCEGQCYGEAVATECSQGMGEVLCNCFIEGSFVGDCTQFSLTCELESSCCDEYVF